MVTRSPKLTLYAVFAAVSFTAALALGRPELAALGAPFALVLAAGLALPGPPAIAVTVRVSRERALEGEEVDAELIISAPEVTCDVDVALRLPPGVRESAPAPALVLRVERGRERVVGVRLSCARWGAHRIGSLSARVHDLAGLRARDVRADGGATLRVYPDPARLRSLAAAARTQPITGNRLARGAGDGIEFADIRPYQPGDRARRINWRASAARQTLHVNQQHPERSSDVVIFLDSFGDARGSETGTLDLAVRAAAALAGHYLADRDRVGLVGFGGVIRWLAPGGGTRQLYRVADALLDTQVVLSYAWKDVTVLPARSLTPHALVVALSPLLDERSVNALLDLRGRGFDLAVVDICPLAFAPPPRGPGDRAAARLWRLWREVLRFRLERLGVPVAEWDGERPLAAVIEEVAAFQRFARRASG